MRTATPSVTEKSSGRSLFEIIDVFRSRVRARYELRAAHVGHRVRCYGALVVSNAGGTLDVGERVVFLGGSVRSELRCEDGGTIRIGPGSVFNYGCSIVSRRSVRIGARCTIASLVQIRDDDGRHTAPVTIGDDVWIAHGAIVEPGTVIGDGAVIATMAVVSGAVPPMSLATGNPARYTPLHAPLSGRETTSPAARGAEPLRARPDARPGAPSRENVRAAIVTWLDDTRCFGAASRMIVSESASLRAAGVLDSLGVVELLTMLEARFGVPIDRARALRPDSQSLDAFIALVTGAGDAPNIEPTPLVPPDGDRVGDAPAEPLHRADSGRRARSQLSSFAAFLASKTGARLDDYGALHAFSVGQLARFWTLFAEWCGLRSEGSLEPACVGAGVEGSHFFPALRVSWVENLLAERSPGDETTTAMVGCDETGLRREVSRADLRRRVRAIAAALSARGLKEGDRVVCVARNTIETVVACLAVTSLGATWSSVGGDMGVDAIVARFRPLAPKVLFFHESSSMNGASFQLPIPAIAGGLPSLEATVLLDASDIAAVPRSSATALSLSVLEREGQALPDADPLAPWRRFAFDHPLFVLFSSGTTGPPKCIVHGHGGTLLEHLKEHRLHCDLGPTDRLCFQTSPGWMMWNWTVSALATGAALVLYDGSVSYPERDSLLQLVAREKVTVFGTSPAYLQFLCDAGIGAATEEGRVRLPELREMLSTGSVLRAPLHRWAKYNVADVPLHSISGGTDIVGCFVMGSPWTDTYEGESGCVGLGLDVRAWKRTEALAGSESARTGDLVCCRPFPSRPVGFLDDPDGARFHAAYFSQHEGVWTHGDLIETGPRESVRVLGRCDGIMNIRGIRIGPSEIYDILSRRVPEVAQAMAVDEASASEPGGKRLVLFVVLTSTATLDRDLTLRIKRALKEGATAAHVPAAVIQVAELPCTFSGKLSEAAMQDALNDRPVRNRAALRNPSSVDAAIAARKSELLRAET